MNNLPMNPNPADNGEPTPQEEIKTFTQEEVNQIIGKRLSEEKTKLETKLVQREQELQQRELIITAKEKLSEKGLPVEILDALNTTSVEALEKSLSIIENHIKKNEVPVKNTFFEGNPRGPRSTEGNSIRKAMGL